MIKQYKLPYHCTDNGDGSASVQFHKTIEEAEKADEEMEDGWGESSADYVELKIEGGKLLARIQDENYKTIWVELQPAE